MNSVLNPEAPEFYPHLTSVTQDGYTKITKTIKLSNHLPAGVAYDIFKTYTDFGVVSCKVSNNVVVRLNDILVNELPNVKLKPKNIAYNTEKIIDANDNIMDRVNIHIDNVCRVNAPCEQFLAGVNPNCNAWSDKPLITKIEVGSAMFFGAKNVRRPQLRFKDTIDNSNNLWVPKISDKPNNIKPLALNILFNDEGQAVGYEHPYKVEIETFEPSLEVLSADPEPPTFPPPLEETNYTYIDTEELVDQLVEHLETVEELAVDVEHHSYRTYQGITCLIQITTYAGDFLVDTLAVREHVHKLNLSFTNPNKIKVFHGAEMDVLWLQRDFGVYVVGMFDTHKAARALNLPALSLKALLFRYCGVNTDKKFQLADWRIRPLPDELVRYARLDTHYLLYIWRRMKGDLLDAGGGAYNRLLSVFEVSRHLCGHTYNKEVLHENSHMNIYTRSKKSFNSRQMAALRMLYRWRDANAREMDESTNYLLPNHMMLTLAETLPKEMQGLSACCHPMSPFLKQNLVTVHRMLLSCRELPLEPLPHEMLQEDEYIEPPQLTYDVLDLGNYPEYTDDGGLDEAAGPLEEVELPENADIAAFKTPKPGTGSRLNVDAKMFIPPYDRYKQYRSLAQIEEIKEYNEKEAKIKAISKGNEYIKTEVLIKLQEAKTLIEKENKKSEKEPEDEAVAPVADVTGTAALRKRKFSNDKGANKNEPNTTQGKTKAEKNKPQKNKLHKSKHPKYKQEKNKLEKNKLEKNKLEKNKLEKNKQEKNKQEKNKPDKNKPVKNRNKNRNKAKNKTEAVATTTTNVKPFNYKNVNYRKFREEPEPHKQSKTKLKKN
ncbi:exosome component 10 isoform X2 [Nymphalis io]|uniref:exosome component 10 isoform X2 n=1 Tax=Inachis io TaxID=171585 RepID=UPI00216A9826|nr:exosome component 10 isoform X2 [Nymphalis io]